MPEGRRHSIALMNLFGVLGRLIPPGWYVEPEQGMEMADERSVPEPDVKVLRGKPAD